MRNIYDAHAWFWIVNGDENRFWSSQQGAYVTSLPDDAGVSYIASELELNDVLAQYGLAGPLPTTYVIPKDLIWRRATDAEAEAMEVALQSQSIRLRRIYDGASVITTDDELFGMLNSAMVAMFGETRAAELLAREE